MASKHYLCLLTLLLPASVPAAVAVAAEKRPAAQWQQRRPERSGPPAPQPLIAGSDGEIEGTAAGERLGGSLALSEEHLLIGVYRAERPLSKFDPAVGPGAGAVQVHTLSAGNWVLDGVLSPGSDGRTVIDELTVEDDALGRSVDIDEMFGIAGMPGDDQAAGWAGAGAVLIRSGSGWRVSEKLVPDAGALGVSTVAGWQVGRSVAIDGDWIALGAPRASFTDSNGVAWAEAGAVLMYRFTGTSWAFERVLISGAPSHFEHFGYAVDIDAGMLVAGIPNADSSNDTNGNQGAIEIFNTSAGAWTRVTRFSAPVFSTTGSRFGESVAVHGSTIAVGEPGYAANRGRAWVLEQAFSGDIDWSAVSSLDLLVPSPPGISGGARMGASIAITDCNILVGGPGNGVVESFTGQAWVFSRASNSENSWTYLELPMLGINPGDGFGDAVALNSTFVAVGAWLGGSLDAGVVTIHEVSCDCDGDGIPDLEQIAADLSIDCNGDGVIDDCQILWDPELDCDGNAVLDSCQFEPPGAFEWPVAQSGNGNWYRVDAPDGDVTRADAVILSLAEGGQLASLNNALEATWVSTRAGHDPKVDGGVWLGGVQVDSAGAADAGWLWEDGIPWSHTNWASGEPDDGDGSENNDENVMSATGTSSGIWVWSDDTELSMLPALLIEFSPNCDGDTELDACQIAQDPSLDCDADGRLDSCQIETGAGADCNGNGQLDSCDITAGIEGADDCDGDGLIDSCALGDGSAQDCNDNGIPDTCDIDDGISDDLDGDLVPDECQLLSINEVLANPTDINNDGIADKEDTYVEIVNRTGDELDVSGWRIRVDGTIWHQFGLLSFIDEDCCAVITGSGSPTDEFFGSGLIEPASQGLFVSLPVPSGAGTHTISLFDNADAFLTEFTYDTSTSGAGISATRCPDTFGAITLHSTCVEGVFNSPGRQTEGNLFDGCPAPNNDFDADGVLDSVDNCIITFNPDQDDCDGDGIGDACAVAFGFDTDCDGNGTPDACDLLDGDLLDCDGNGQADVCEIAIDPSLDCNESGSLDTCELADGLETDCNANNVIDACEIDEFGADCDFDGILDICEDPEDVTGGPDLNGDCLVDVADLIIVLDDLGCQGPDCVGDIDGDGDTDTYDLIEIVNIING